MSDQEKGSEKPPAYNACKQEDEPRSQVVKLTADKLTECVFDVWERPCNMSLFFESGKTGSPDYWIAQMWVLAYDIPKLMRSGFACEEANIEREKGYFAEGNWKNYASGVMAMPLHRMVCLADATEDKSWTATLLIGAHRLPTLSTFRVADLHEQICVEAVASTKLGMVYSFEAQNPAANFNAIYDDMPMTGLWPWPKKKESEVTGEGEQSLLDAPFVEIPDPQ